LIQDLYFYGEVASYGARGLPEDLKLVVDHLKSSDSVPEVVRLWASIPADADKKLERQEIIEELHDKDYLECGIQYHENA
jgi:hypothetical protein